MNRFFKGLVLGFLVVGSSSCNIDEEYTSAQPITKAECSTVFEYTPAPGQFINEPKTGGFDGTQTTPDRAVEYAEKRLQKKLFVSLGGFGGYIVVGFDHNVLNFPKYDFSVRSNSFDGSSEPAVVWVMQDENENGLPDDTWYELAGSETGKAETIQNYAVTYYRPSAPKMAVQWKDNQGNEGEIEYMDYLGDAYNHSQDYYYPAWIKEDNYTLTGTCLKARNYSQEIDGGLHWENPCYDWGYADNFSPEDFVAKDKSNKFDISNAIDAEGAKVELDYINFVKVQCAVNAQSGRLGELSTEVSGFKDLNFE